MERCLTVVSIIACIAVGTEEYGINTPTSSALVLPRSCTVYSGVKTRKYVATKSREPAYNRRGVCDTVACVHAAATVLSKMKREIEPCDDFYQFACGKFIDATEIPEDKKKINTISLVTDELQKQLRDIITEERPETDPKHLRLPNTFYKACMNTALIERLGARPIQKISDSVGGWPVIVGKSWNSGNSWTWQENVKKLKRFGYTVGGLINFSIKEDSRNTTRRILNLDQPFSNLGREYLVKGIKSPEVAIYYEYMVDLAVLFGAKEASAKRELMESLQFEINLAKISWPDERRRNANDLYNLRSIKQLQVIYPFVQWLDYINSLLPEDVQVDENEIINLAVPSFFEDLGKLLQRTNKRAIANYFMWRLHEYAVGFLSERYRKRQLQYSFVMTGIKDEEPRWKQCTDIALFRFAISMGSLYVRKHFKEDSKHIALEMINNIRDVFGEILDKVSWMDDTTKQEAKKKLHAMATYIGYPDEILDDDKLQEYYRKLDISPHKYFESYLNMNLFFKSKLLSKLRLPVNKTDWTAHAEPAVVNAKYSEIENSITFPAGILQGHFFNRQHPKFMNYGAIGYIIGHEITHGFDDQGRRFDLYGNLKDWWQPETEKAFLEKTQCIIEQYGNYTDKQTGLNLNGINTQGENIADNGGIKVAYGAYKKWVAKNGEEPRLPGLNYTPQQLFWISVAQTWCGKTRKESQKNKITFGSHSPDELRILGSLSNMKDFSRDFQCPVGTPMNPKQKCEVW